MNHTHGIDKSQLAGQAGAAGLILVNPKQLENKSLPLPYHLPTSLVEFDDAQSIIAYNNSIKYLTYLFFMNKSNLLTIQFY